MSRPLLLNGSVVCRAELTVALVFFWVEASLARSASALDRSKTGAGFQDASGPDVSTGVVKVFLLTFTSISFPPPGAG